MPTPQAPQGAPIQAPAVTSGVATYLGVAVAVLGGVGAIVGAAEANDTATVTAAAAGILAALTTIGGRMAQAIAIVRSAAAAAEPWIDAVQAALRDKPKSVAVKVGDAFDTTAAAGQPYVSGNVATGAVAPIDGDDSVLQPTDGDAEPDPGPPLDDEDETR